MRKYSYIKKAPVKNRPMIAFISYLAIILGSGFVFWSFYPVLSFEIYSRFFISRLPQSGIALAYSSDPSQQVGRVAGEEQKTNASNTNLTDYTNTAAWFPTADTAWRSVENNHEIETAKLSLENITQYSLSVPKLKIENAKVNINDQDLSRGLVHYLAKSLPGEYGNVVIFGHSTLPQLYNPKNYKTIFTYLPSLEKGDMINVKIAEKSVDYEVYDMFVVNPDQISILDQQYDASYLTLVTCVPPGTYWKRLVVKAKLKQ